MSKFGKLIQKILSGSSDRNIDFNDLCNLLETLGFDNRIKGSHHIYYKKGIDEIINLQPFNDKAKAYQVKQVRELLIKYKLITESDE
ncbi:MAG TPA: type II toxin-antitoxin system HicA family toxin [Chitinophagaceae bacterium]